jgi:hypothetical protein
MISASFLAHRGVRAGLVAVAMLTAYLAGKASPPSPIVITVQPAELERPRPSGPEGGFNVTALAAQSGAAQVMCSQPSPDSAWTCQDGYWPPPEPVASGGGQPAGDNGCLTPPPANGMTCRGGLWMLSGTADVAVPTIAPATTTTSDVLVPTAETNPVGYVPMVEPHVIPVTVIGVPSIEVPVIATPTIPTPTVVIRSP